MISRLKRYTTDSPLFYSLTTDSSCHYGIYFSSKSIRILTDRALSPTIYTNRGLKRGKGGLDAYLKRSF